VEIKVPHTGSFFSSPAEEGLEGGRELEAPACGEEVLDKPLKALLMIPSTDRITLIMSMNPIR
jgi:hypothetical protein